MVEGWAGGLEWGLTTQTIDAPSKKRWFKHDESAAKAADKSRNVFGSGAAARGHFSSAGTIRATRGCAGRSRAIIYNTKLVKPEELPTTAFDLINPRWKGKLAAVNAGNESFVAWVSALRLTLGDELVKAFLIKLKENKIALLSSSHTDVRKAVGRGEFAIGLINHYYFHLQKQEPDSAVREVGILYHDQGVFQLGTLINAAGAAIVKNAKNLKEAQQLLDFLVSPEAQKLFAELNFEYPLLAGVPTEPSVLLAVQQATNCKQATPLGCLKQLPVPLDDLGEQLENTQKLLEEVGWF